ncbi:zinc-binding dehydrogenase [Streptomyces capparidis]
MSALMDAAVLREYGGPGALRVETIPEPVPGPDEVLIDVTVAGLNFADLYRRAGRYDPPPLPAVLGADVAGTLRSDGRRVAALLRRRGGYAQAAAAKAALTVPLPDDVDDRQAVALLEQGLTAHGALFTLGRLRAGESVAVTAAAGGVGHLAVQLAREAGASRVVGTASTAAKRAFLRDLGVDAALDPASPELAEELREATHGGPDLCLDTVGGPLLHTALDALAPFGRLVSVGERAETGDDDGAQRVAVADLARRSVGVLGFWLRHTLEDRALFTASTTRLFDLAATGRLTAHIDRVVPLSAVPAAHTAMERRTTLGKILIDPWA